METVKSIVFRVSDGSLKKFKCLENKKADEDSQANLIFHDKDGNEVIFTKQVIKSKNGEKEYAYVLCDGGSEVTTSKPNLPKDKNYFWTMGDCGWDRDVDKFFDGMLSVDSSKATTDGKDDGSLTWTEIGKHTLKGALTPVKAIVKSPVKSAIIGGALIAAGIAFPPLGVAMAAVGLAVGIGTALFGAFKVCTAKTDGAAKAACENIGSGVVTAALSAIGLKKANVALKAKQTAFSTSTKYQPPSSSPTSSPAPATADTPEYSGIAKFLSGFGKKAQVAVDATKNAAKTLADTTKTVVDVAKHPKVTISKYDLPTGQDADGIAQFGQYAKTAIGFFDKRGADMSTINNLRTSILGHIHDGHHWQAKQGISQISQIIKGGKIGADDLEVAKGILTECTNLAKATKFINRPPAAGSTATTFGYVDNAFDSSATMASEISRDAYEFVS